MEHEIIGIAQKPNTRNINERIAITELLEMGASWMGMVACWWATMLMQGGIFFTLETKDCLFAIVIFLFICFRHRLYFCPQATWSLTEVNRSLWTNNIQQLALSIGCISRLFYWYKLFSAITCAVLSMMRLISQDFGQTEVANMATRNFAINVFYVLALIETLLLLLALILRMLYERAKKENKEHKVERAKEENKEHKEEEKDDENEAEHEIIEIPDQTNTCIQQQDSSNLMLDNNGEGTSHTMTGKGAPEKFFFKENTRRRKNLYERITASSDENLEDTLEEFIRKTREAQILELKMSSEDRSLKKFTILKSKAISLGFMVSSWAVIMLWGDHIFTLETKDRMFITVIILLVYIRLLNFCLQVNRYRSGDNNIQQHTSGLLYWFQLVSVLICVVLSMMGLVSQYYGQTEMTNMVSKHVLSSFYCLTLAEALLSLSKIRYTRIMTMQQTFIDAMPGRQRIKELRKASEHPVASIPEQEKCKIIEKKTK